MPRLRYRPRAPERQLDLFPTDRLLLPSPVPRWSTLPDQARHAVTTLMTRLLVMHVNGVAPEAEGDVDER